MDYKFTCKGPPYSSKQVFKNRLYKCWKVCGHWGICPHITAHFLNF